MIFGLFVSLSLTAIAASDLSEYFPNATDATKVTWAHAVNNKTLLQNALTSDVNMLEADISLGKLSPSDKTEIPIMAHPPAKVSDLSLKDFLSAVNKHNINNTEKYKGVKLDFKSIEAFNASVSVLKDNLKDLKPVWLNADILSGPVNATTKPVDAQTFISISNKEFDNITLSIGWTTNYNSTYTGQGYTMDQIQEMITTVNKTQVKHKITFPVRAGLAAESYTEMKHLVQNVSESSLTVWSSENDPVDVEKLNFLIKHIGLDKVYIDVPKNLSDQLNFNSAGNRSPFGIYNAMALSIIMFVLNSVLCI